MNDGVFHYALKYTWYLLVVVAILLVGYYFAAPFADQIAEMLGSTRRISLVVMAIPVIFPLVLPSLLVGQAFWKGEYQKQPFMFSILLAVLCGIVFAGLAYGIYYLMQNFGSEQVAQYGLDLSPVQAILANPEQALVYLGGAFAAVTFFIWLCIGFAVRGQMKNAGVY